MTDMTRAFYDRVASAKADILAEVVMGGKDVFIRATGFQPEKLYLGKNQIALMRVFADRTTKVDTRSKDMTLSFYGLEVIPVILDDYISIGADFNENKS